MTGGTTILTRPTEAIMPVYMEIKLMVTLTPTTGQVNEMDGREIFYCFCCCCSIVLIYVTLACFGGVNG